MKRLRIDVTGIVQGVGFRPFIYNLARRMGLTGWVLNDSTGVAIEVEGAAAALDAFVAAIKCEAPPLAVIDNLVVAERSVQFDIAFEIKDSIDGQGSSVLVAPDIGTCSACVLELQTAGDRRYHYPFINCTNCGPRYSIISAVPYDRTATTMAAFTMCSSCASEYRDCMSRRFHAQPNACPQCGPSYRLLDRRGCELAGDPLAAVRQLVHNGSIVAIKGIGGYHLACDAKNAQAVAALRQRKRREAKPFAVMCINLTAVKRLCHLSAAERTLLESPARPIVLLAKKSSYNLAPGVAPNNAYLGVMLAYAPVHWLLLDNDDVWVMTSGNDSGQPIVYDDKNAYAQLAGIADYFLVHNRTIYRPVEDSVVRAVNDRPLMLRRSRGFAPVPLALTHKVPPLLACGGHLKNTFCLASFDKAFISPHLGDLDNMAAYENFCTTITHFRQLFGIAPKFVAHDLHPDYLSTQYASALGLPAIAVQHHHAHITAVMAEHGLTTPVIGIALDGTGYGEDGRLWGGEVLLADYKDFTRLSHCRYLPLPGGTKAITEPWRLACWLVHKIYGQQAGKLNLPFIKNLPAAWPLMVEAADQGLNSPLSSSAGRLFDAAAALLGLCSYNEYEGQAAMELEYAAGKATGYVLPYDITTGTPAVLDFLPAFAAMTEALLQGEQPEVLAAAFHNTVAAAFVQAAVRQARQTGVKQVVLSGGVFQNIILLQQVVRMLQQSELKVLLPHKLPPNDGGIALGQAVIAAERSR